MDALLKIESANVEMGDRVTENLRDLLKTINEENITNKVAVKALDVYGNLTHTGPVTISGCSFTNAENKEKGE